MNISNRLQVISSFVRHNSVVADIGTDHAYLPIYLVQEGVIKKAFACDIKKAPLNLAKTNIEENNLEDNIKTILSDGLDNVPLEQVDDIVIAGMGGETICNIIKRAKPLKYIRYKLILQPMTKQYELRKFLYENGFKIVSEGLALEQRRVYNIFNVSYNKSKVTLEELHIGKNIISDKATFKLYKKQLLKRFNRKLAGELNSRRPDKDKILLLEDLIDKTERRELND